METVTLASQGRCEGKKISLDDYMNGQVSNTSLAHKTEL